MFNFALYTGKQYVSSNISGTRLGVGVRKYSFYVQRVFSRRERINSQFGYRDDWGPLRKAPNPNLEGQEK